MMAITTSFLRAIQWTEGPGNPDPFVLGEIVSGDAYSARAISDDGSVVVGWNQTRGRTATMWVNGVKTVELSNTVEGTAVSGDGQVMVGSWWQSIGGDYNGDKRVDAADYTVWRDNQGAAPGTLSNDIDGGVIGEAQYATWRANYGKASPESAEAWRWSADGGLEPLGCLNGDCGGGGFGQVTGRSVDVNQDGTLILGYERGMSDPGIAGGDGWVWREGLGLTALETYFRDEGLVLTSEWDNFRFSLPLGMSRDERTFFGIGIDEDEGGPVGWIVTLPPVAGAAAAAVPEPSGLLLGLVVLAAGGITTRRRE